MAEILTPEKQNGKVFQKKKLIRVDMTPMVDLGFLLITFFMFAASFSKPNVMDLGLPAKGPHPPIDIDYRNQISFILGKNNQIFYYQKDLKELQASDLKSTTFERLEIAKLIQQYKKAAPKPDYFTVIVKPSEESTYNNFVDIIDEIAIAKIERYGISEMNRTEEQIYQKSSQ